MCVVLSQHGPQRPDDVFEALFFHAAHCAATGSDQVEPTVYARIFIGEQGSR